MRCRNGVMIPSLGTTEICGEPQLYCDPGSEAPAITSPVSSQGIEHPVAALKGSPSGPTSNNFSA
jgi:hypothetical protein